MADTITTYLGLTAPEVGTAGYAPKINADLVLIDTAHGTKLAHLVQSGATAGAASYDIVFPAPLAASYILVIEAIRSSTTDNIGLWARLSIDGGANFLSGASDYEYVRRDLSNQAGGTQALVGSSAASYIPLTPETLKGASTTASPRHRIVMQIASTSLPAASIVDTCLEVNAVYKTTSGYRARSEISAAPAISTAAGVSAVRLGGVQTGTLTFQLGLNYALYAVPGTA
jgi:hypothetical protein